MISVPYKLNMYWTWSLPTNPTKQLEQLEQSKQSEQPKQLEQQSQSLEKEQADNKDQTLEKEQNEKKSQVNKKKVNIDNKVSIGMIKKFNQIDSDLIENNKLKKRILDMYNKEFAWLVTDSKTGFDFKFEISNDNRINKDTWNEYVLQNGIFGPMDINNFNKLNQYINFGTDKLIFNIIDWKIDSIDAFIEKWNQDRIKFESGLPEIFFYGTIYDTDKSVLSYYYITKKYQTYHSIIKFDFAQTVNYFKKLLSFIDQVVASEYVYRDLELFGIGWDYNYDKTDIVFKIIKYTSNTLVSLQGNYFESFTLTRCDDKSCIGSLIPYYVVDDYYNLKQDWLKRLVKSYCLGLTEIILILFYNNDAIMNKLYNFIIEPSFLESKLQYFHIYNRFGILDNYKELTNLVIGLTIRFCDINPLFDSMMASIVLNLLERDYDIIFYPYHILSIIKKIEESNEEFKVEYSIKDKIYVPDEQNFLKTSYLKKVDIIKNDDLNKLMANIQIEPNSFKDIEPIRIDNKNLKKKVSSNIESSKSKLNSDSFIKKKIEPIGNKNFKELYLKYKNKYLRLKNN
jgi:hypothetical protein